MAAAVASGIVILSVGGAYGIGFVMPLLPWTVAASVAAVDRRLPARTWRIWAAVVVAVAVGNGLVIPGSGLSSDLIWCANDQPRSSCEVDTDAEGRAWNQAIAEVGDRVWRAQGASSGDFAVALLARDLLLNGNGLGLELELRHGVGVDFYRFFQPQETKEQQLSRMVDEADLLVVAEDFRPKEVVLGTYQPAPADAIAAARDAGFTSCDEITLPDDRLVTVLAAPGSPPATCE